jgi:hypothetical protein
MSACLHVLHVLQAGLMFHTDDLLTPFMVQDARAKAAGRAGLAARASFASGCGGRGAGKGRGGSSSLFPSWGAGGSNSSRGGGGRGGNGGAAWGLGGDFNLLWEGLLLLATAAEAYEQLGSKGGLDVLRSAEATGSRAVLQLLRSQACQADYGDLVWRLEVGLKRHDYVWWQRLGKLGEGTCRHMQLQGVRQQQAATVLVRRLGLSAWRTAHLPVHLGLRLQHQATAAVPHPKLLVHPMQHCDTQHHCC